MNHKIHASLQRLALVASLSFAVTSCGQDPSFLELESAGKKGEASTVARGSKGHSPDSVADIGSSDATGGGGASGGDGAGGDGAGAGDTSGGDMSDETVAIDTNGDGIPDATVTPGVSTGGGDPVTGSPGSPGNMPTLPGSSDDEVETIRRCMQKWNQNPFGNGTVNVRRIYASVNVLGVGTAINDTIRTQSPELVIIYAGVNVGGTTTWNLMNPNGWYCAKVNVNVQQTLNVNLHCNARLADSLVSVNVGSTTNSATAAVGVNVLSNVNVQSVRPQGDACIR